MATVEPVTVTLARPLTLKSGEERSSLTFKPATLGDALDAEEFESESSREAALFAKMCGLELPDFRELWNGDYQEVRRQAGPLTGSEDASILEAVLRQVGVTMPNDEMPSGSSPDGSLAI